MDGIEQAIRRALAKGDARDEAFRETVYRSAFAALDRSLKANPDMTVENAIKRRKALQATVRSVEAEYLAGGSVAVPPEPAPVHARTSTHGAAPSLDGERRWHEDDDAPSLDTAFDPPMHGGARRKGGIDLGRSAKAPRKRSSGRMASIVTGLVLLAVVAGGGLWAFVNFGHLMTTDLGQLEAAFNESRGQAGPPPLSSDGVDPDAGWTSVFVPGSGDEDAAFRVDPGADGQPVPIALDADALRENAGARVIFAIAARAAEGTPTQMTVTCDFEGSGECRRTRYEVGAAEDDFLFETTLPQSTSGTSSLLVAAGLAGQGAGIDIRSIRMRAVE